MLSSNSGLRRMMGSLMLSCPLSLCVCTYGPPETLLPHGALFSREGTETHSHRLSGSGSSCIHGRSTRSCRATVLSPRHQPNVLGQRLGDVAELGGMGDGLAGVAAAVALGTTRRTGAAPLALQQPPNQQIPASGDGEGDDHPSALERMAVHLVLEDSKPRQPRQV
uniref:Uncharacterized protein n=1 Tax=uncultured marine virus TaxID=186617 RepID=A0A0F7L6Y0_9VIRU|nr:hypothetical protein [uncultured marine virus]